MPAHRKDAETAAMLQLYEEGLSLDRIAKRYGLTRQSVWIRLRRRQAPMRSQKRFGTDNHFYRGGGRKVTERGYVKIYVGSGRWRFEHRVVMERELGRALSPKENVHHLNGDKADNRPANLALMSHSSHSSHHKKGYVPSLESINKHRDKMIGKWMHRPDVTTRAALELREQGLSVHQIAQRLGCSWHTAKTRLREPAREQAAPESIPWN